MFGWWSATSSLPQRLIPGSLLFSIFIKELDDFGVNPQQIQTRGSKYHNTEQGLINWRTGPAKILRNSTRRSTKFCVAGTMALRSVTVRQRGDRAAAMLKRNLNCAWTISSLSSRVRQIAC